MDLSYEVKDDKYTNIKEVLRAEFGVSSRLYLKLRNNNRIFINSKSDCINNILSIGDIIEIDLNFNEESANIVSTKMDLNIIYEDDYLLVINKPANLAVHPSLKHFENSLSNGVKYYFNAIRFKEKD